MTETDTQVCWQCKIKYCLELQKLFVNCFLLYFNTCTAHFLMFLSQPTNAQLILQPYISQEHLFI